jgi:hypothetical protein
MIVFAESNFVLELVLRQSEAAFALRIVELAEQNRIQLCIPAFSLVEPHHKLMRERNERRELRESLDSHVGQMARSETLSDIRTQSNALLVALAGKSDADMKEHENWIGRIVKCANVLPLTDRVLAAGLGRTLLDLDLLDAFVYSSIEAHLKEIGVRESLFANRDAKAFMQPTVLDDLQKLGCRVIPKFANAVAYIEGRLPSSRIT